MAGKFPHMHLSAIWMPILGANKIHWLGWLGWLGIPNLVLK